MNEQLIAYVVKSTQDTIFCMDAVDTALKALIKQGKYNARQRGFNLLTCLALFLCMSGISSLSTQLDAQNKKIKALEAKLNSEESEEKKGA